MNETLNTRLNRNHHQIFSERAIAGMTISNRFIRLCKAAK
jgi:hypothetical protein